MAVAKKKERPVIFFLRKLYNSFVPVDVATALAMEAIPGNEENYFTITKLTAEEVRTAAQNRLLWMWYTDMEKTTANEWAGRTKDDWHYEMKKRFLVRIYERDDESYALLLVSIRSVRESGLKRDAAQIFRHIVRETSTTDATVLQFSEYLNEISRFCGMNGIWLRTDDRLLALAMGIK